MNFIQRTGTLELEGGLRLSTTDYGTRRADAYLTGPITPKTVFAIGGFYRASDGLRHTQFPADLGGQITANITHEFEGGRVTAYARRSGEHTSELQSLMRSSYAVFCLKKKRNTNTTHNQ